MSTPQKLDLSKADVDIGGVLVTSAISVQWDDSFKTADTVQKGDSYTTIAKKFYGDVVFRKQIRKANDYQDLAEGDIIIIPTLISHEELTFTKKYWERKNRRGK